MIRFSPFLPEKLLANAQDTFVDDEECGHPSPRYGVSVIAGWCEEHETITDTVARILKSTTLGGRTIAVVTGRELRGLGFDVVEDANAKEPLHHLVGDSPFTEPPRVDVLASLLEDGKMRNPAWTKGAA